MTPRRSSRVTDAVLLYVLDGAEAGLNEHAEDLRPWISNNKTLKIESAILAREIYDRHGRRFLLMVSAPNEGDAGEVKT